jgi:hypothetical protein
MTTMCVNGEHLVDLSEEDISSLPEQFGIGDLEKLVVDSTSDSSTCKVVSVREVYLEGQPLDKRKLNGFPRQKLLESPVLGVWADIESKPAVVHSSSVAHSVEENQKGKRDKKAGKKEAKNTMEINKEAPTLVEEKVISAQLGWLQYRGLEKIQG